jgi:hypothetical protein
VDLCYWSTKVTVDCDISSILSFQVQVHSNAVPFWLDEIRTLDSLGVI